MKPIKVLELSEVDRLKLEKGYHNGPTHSFRIRCKSILLKSEGKSASKIAEMLEVTVPTVYTWVICHHLQKTKNVSHYLKALVVQLDES